MDFLNYFSGVLWGFPHHLVESFYAIFRTPGINYLFDFTTFYNYYYFIIVDADMYPPYSEILKCKKESYPVFINEDFSEAEAKIPLQNLVDKTIERLFKTFSEQEFPPVLSASYKWGMDGSSGHSEFKQRFSNSENSDATIFCTNIVPLSIKSESAIIWTNKKPNSARYLLIFE